MTLIISYIYFKEIESESEKYLTPLGGLHFSMTNCENNLPAIPHVVNLEGRKKLSITGVKEVDNFDEHEITANTSAGKLLIKGSNLNIKKLNLETCDLEITGKISALDYLDSNSGIKGGVFKKLFK